MTEGTITVTRLLAGTRERLRIERADPTARISADLLEEIRQGSPWAEVDGDVLRIHDDFGASFTYRIGERDAGTYALAWPD